MSVRRPPKLDRTAAPYRLTRLPDQAERSLAQALLGLPAARGGRALAAATRTGDADPRHTALVHRLQLDPSPGHEMIKELADCTHGATAIHARL
jgi:hypothetical protein